MNEFPLISVLIPAYNHEKYVESCVKSVLEQDWPRIELVVIDDGSRDATWNILQSLRTDCEKRCERVEMVTQENQGTCVTLNRLCEKARGDFVALFASDDMYLPGALSAMAAKMMNDESIGLVVGQCELMDGSGKRCYWDERRNVVYDEKSARYRTLNEHAIECVGLKNDDEDFGTYAKLLHCNHIANGFLVRRSALLKVLPYRREAPMEDWWFHLQLSKIVRYKTIPEHTFRYRWHANNTVKRSKLLERMAIATLMWEARHVRELQDPKWAKIFDKETNTERTVWRVGPWLRMVKRKNVWRKQSVLCIGAREWVWHERYFKVNS